MAARAPLHGVPPASRLPEALRQALGRPAQRHLHQIDPRWTRGPQVWRSGHRAPDVIFDEDACRVRGDHGAGYLALMQRITLKLIEPTRPEAASSSSATGRRGAMTS